MANVNIEKVVIGFLEANKSDDFAVFGDMPDPRPEGFVLVDRTGGPRDNIVQDRAELLIETYHKDSRQSASDEAYRIADIMEALLGIEAITHVKVNSVVKLDDLLGQYWRYQIYVDIFYRRGEIDGAINYPVVPPGTFVTSVNGQTGDVTLDANDVGADAEGSAAAAEAAAILAANGYTDEQIAALIAEGFGDEPSTFLNLDNKICSLLGEYITGGTMGRMWYNRQGRHIRGHVAIFGNPSNDWGFDPFKSVLIKNTDLPYLPRNFGEIPEVQYPITEVGNFGLVASNNGVDVSIGGSIGSAFSTVGQYPNPQMIFFKAVDFTDGQLGNLVYDNNPIALAGMNWNIIARFSYEAAYEEGYINISETYASANQDAAYDESVAIVISSGYQLPFTVEVIAGALPDGLSLTPSGESLQLSGTPTESGNFTFTAKLTGDNGDEYEKEFTLTVNPPYVPSNIDIQGDFDASGNVGIAYSSQVDVVLEDEGAQLPISQAVIAGAIPDGLALSIQNDNELILSGEPTDTGVFAFVVEITDNNGATNSKNFEVTIDPYNPELEAGYLGTVSGNSLNINLVPDWETYYGFFSMNIFSFITAGHSQPGQILKIRSGPMNQDFGEGTITVLVGEYMIFEGGYWRKYIYA